MVFPVMRNEPVRETQILDDALQRLVELMPASWRLEEHRGSSLEQRRLDAVVKMVGPNEVGVSYALEGRRSGTAPTSLLVPALREIERVSDMPVLFVSDYIGPALRDVLASEGLSFADATGWVRVTSDDPLILLTGQGAARAPRDRRTSAVTRLNGLAANRTIRALTAVELPTGVRGLAGAADVSPGSVSKLLATLAAEGIVDRDNSGSVVAVRRRALMKRWALDYSFAKTNASVGHFIAPRGLERTLTRLKNRADVAVTGSAAARRLLPESVTSVVPLRLLAIYAAHPQALALELGLIDAEPANANVVIASPQDPDIPTSSGEDGVAVAPVPLVITDLLTLPGRSDAEAEQLMDLLAAGDETWVD
jgi:hypothetical protein